MIIFKKQLRKLIQFVPLGLNSFSEIHKCSKTPVFTNLEKLTLHQQRETKNYYVNVNTNVLNSSQKEF